MGGKGSGGVRPISARRGRLPKRYRPGCIARLDQRSAVAREVMRDIEAIVTEHRGGPENVTPLDSMLIESLVFANAWRRRVEEAAINGGVLDVQKYVALIDRVHGIAKTIGLKRAVKDVPSLAAIAQEKK